MNSDVKKLKAEENLWRLRVGRWRVVYSKDAKLEILYLEEIVRRTDTTYS